MLNKLYTQADFLNLTSDDINKIKEMLEIEVPDEIDDYEYLYKNINIIEANCDANKIVSEKILAGQLSVKWFKYRYYEEFKKEDLINRLESEELGYNTNIEDRISLNIENGIFSIVKNENIYTLKVFISDGYKRINNGIESRREPVVKSIIIKIDIDNCWIEIRGNEEKCRKINKILEASLGIRNIKEISVLNNYKNIHDLKDSLVNGFYLKYKAIPSEEIELTEDDGVAIGTIVKLIDEYFNDKNHKKLLDSLEELDYDTEGLSLSSILLAGIDNVGMKIRNNSERDVSKQSLYTILKDDLIEDSSYIRFSIVPNGVQYTMQVGIKTNSIVFRSSVTEEVINYIRNKVI